MSRTFFTGCTHFGHANIIRLANRPFESAEHMDQCLMDNWNSVVGDRDTVYHLGDFAWWKGHTSPYSYRDRLNGRVIALQGNHDPWHWGRDYLEIKAEGHKIVLFHYPVAEWNGWYQGSLHLHCHTHQLTKVSAERRFNVTVEAWDYRPVALEEILDLAREMKWV